MYHFNIYEFGIIGKLKIHLLDNAQISIFSKVDIMYLLLYWVTYTRTGFITNGDRLKIPALVHTHTSFNQHEIQSHEICTKYARNMLITN